jgi:hypothetical protein
MKQFDRQQASSFSQLVALVQFHYQYRQTTKVEPRLCGHSADRIQFVTQNWTREIPLNMFTLFTLTFRLFQVIYTRRKKSRWSLKCVLQTEQVAAVDPNFYLRIQFVLTPLFCMDLFADFELR